MLKSLIQSIDLEREITKKQLDITVPNAISHFNWFARYDNSDATNSQANSTANITAHSFHSNV